MPSMLCWHTRIPQNRPAFCSQIHEYQTRGEHEASGDGLRERGTRGVVEGSVVEWDEDGSNVRAGPNKRFYESLACRKECGAHMLPNAFWEVQNFCVQQMLPRDGMHAIDLGALIRLIMAILLKYLNCVEIILGIEGLAAKKLEERMRRCLARREGPDGQLNKYARYAICVLPILTYFANI